MKETGLVYTMTYVYASVRKARVHQIKEVKENARSEQCVLYEQGRRFQLARLYVKGKPSYKANPYKQYVRFW